MTKSADYLIEVCNREIRKLRNEIFKEVTSTLGDQFTSQELSLAHEQFLALHLINSLNLPSRDLILEFCRSAQQYYKDVL